MIKQLITLPNLLTILRMVLVPVFVWLFLLGDGWLLGALVIFTVAALTDYGDGFVARRRGEVSGLGILLDPIADKVLVTTVLSCFAYVGMLPWWFVVLIVGRDLVITGVRWAWHTQPAAMAPSYLGKCKTVAQIILIYVLFACLITQSWLVQEGWYNAMMSVVKVIMYLVAGVTAYTGVDYLRRYWVLRRRGPSSVSGGQVAPEQVIPARQTTPDNDHVTEVPPLIRQKHVKPARRVKMARRQDGS